MQRRCDRRLARRPSQRLLRPRSDRSGTRVSHSVETARSETHDLAVVRSARAGDAAGVKRVIDRMLLIPRLLHSLNRRMGAPVAPNDLDDLAQDVAIIVWRKLEAYGGGASLEAWMYRICVLELHNYVRRRRRGMDVAGDASDIPMARPTGLGADQYTAVHRALDELPPDEQEVIRLKHFDGLSFGEIADESQVALGTAKTRYYRAVARLRTLLAGRSDARDV